MSRADRLRFAAYVLLGIPGWLANSLATLPFQLAGVLVVPVLAWRKRYAIVPSPRYPGRMVLAFTDRWAFPWSNAEDGIDGSANGFWPKQPPGSFAEWWQIVRWAVWRNSAANLRWWPFFGFTNPTSGQSSIGSHPFGPFVVRYGWRVMLRVPWTRGKPDGATPCFTIGWRLDTPGIGCAMTLHLARALG